MKERFSIILILLLTLLTAPVQAQQNKSQQKQSTTQKPVTYITGSVLIDEDGLPAYGATVHYLNHPKTKVLVQNNGKYRIRQIPGTTLVFHCFGYADEKVQVKSQTKINIRLKSSSREMKEVEVKVKKKRYKRKGNPAVDLMRKAMEAKRLRSIYNNPYFSYDKYLRLTIAQNDVTDTTKVYKRKQKFTDLVKKYAYRNPETGRMILPISFQETYSQEIYQKNPERKKSLILGTHTETVLDVLTVTDAFEQMFKDCFTDIDIFQNRTKVLRHNFLSPLGGQAAINFFHYAIEDTVLVGQDSCYKVSFAPANPTDMGFSGSLFIRKDSSYRVRSCHMNIPRQSNVNWVEGMTINQDFDTLSTGEQVCTRNRMALQLKATDWIKKFYVEHDAIQSNFSKDSIDRKEFKFIGDEKVEDGADKRDSAFWLSVRPDSIQFARTDVQGMKENLMSRRWMKNLVFLGRSLLDNNIPTTWDPMKQSKFEIGPVFSMVGKDWLEGWRLRFGGGTTPAFHKHLYMSGYFKYGFGDKVWKGGATLMWCFKARKNQYNDFPMRNISVVYTYDTHSPFSRYMENNRDNVFQSLNWASNRMMSYFRQFKVSGDFEFRNGVSININLTRETNWSTGTPAELTADGMDHDCIYRTLNGTNIGNYTTADIMLGIEYRPGVKWVSTKSKRHETNHNAPIFGISHTMGISGVLGGQYNYNYTEITLQKRFWLDAWGNFDARITGGVQWNQVPYPLLIVPHSNLSFFWNRRTFSLIRSMEFLNDRTITGMFRWDLNGKFFNLFPINKKLKWREVIGCNILWGNCSAKNNPDNYFVTDPQTGQRILDPSKDPGCLMQMPKFYKSDGTYWYGPTEMSSMPYIEVSVGIHNIFRLLSVDLFRRLTYTDGDITKWGVRFGFQATF